MKVSIIMPVYNSEKYLCKAIDSVLVQDFDGFELILVDDGSTDGSSAICDSFAEKYDNVKVVHKENGGICSARNTGLDKATGEYVGFCDNDDEYLPHLIRDNYTYAKENDVDLMRYAKIKRLERDDGKVWETISQIDDMCIERKEFYLHYNNIRREDTIWTGFYRREIIEKYHIRFDENFRFGSEDLNFNLHFLKYCEKLGFNSKAYYSWTQRNSRSTSRNFKRDYLKKNMINMDLEYEFMVDVCNNQVDNVTKNIFLINSYVHPIIDYMEIKNCDMSIKEKCEYLEELRVHPLFDGNISDETLKAVRSKNKRMYITMKLFYQRKYRLLMFVLQWGTGILGVFRFKS